MFEKLFRERRIEGPRKSIDSYTSLKMSLRRMREKKASNFEINAPRSILTRDRIPLLS